MFGVSAFATAGPSVRAGSAPLPESLEGASVVAAAGALGAPGKRPGKPPFIANAPPPTSPPKITNPAVATSAA